MSQANDGGGTETTTPRNYNSPKLQLPPAFHGFQHGYFVGVFNVAAHGNSHGYASYPKALALELLRQISGGSFAFDRWIGGEDYLFNLAAADAGHQIFNPQLVGTYP